MLLVDTVWKKHMILETHTLLCLRCTISQEIIRARRSSSPDIENLVDSTAVQQQSHLASLEAAGEPASKNRQADSGAKRAGTAVVD
jgi:hypothetical protein